jgi:hypothetical protein
VTDVEAQMDKYDRTGAAAELPNGSGLVVRDASVTPALEAEGLARDLVRVVQQARQDNGLEVSDRSRLTIGAPESVLAAARTHEALIRAETLALDVAYIASSDDAVGKVGGGAGRERRSCPCGLAVNSESTRKLALFDTTLPLRRGTRRRSVGSVTECVPRRAKRAGLQRVPGRYRGSVAPQDLGGAPRRLTHGRDRSERYGGAAFGGYAGRM